MRLEKIHPGPFCVQKPQHKTFHKKYYLNQFEAFRLLKPEKPHVGAILRTLWPENLKTRFFPKKIALVNFKSLLL